MWSSRTRRRAARPRVVSYCSAARPRAGSAKIRWVMASHSSTGRVAASTRPAARLMSRGFFITSEIRKLIGCSTVRRALAESRSAGAAPVLGVSGRVLPGSLIDCHAWYRWTAAGSNSLPMARRRGCRLDDPGDLRVAASADQKFPGNLPSARPLSTGGLRACTLAGHTL